MDMLERRGTRLIIRLPAEVDHHSAEEIRRRVDAVLAQEPVSEAEFDFSETVFMDSAGIGLLIGRYKLMQALDGRVLLTHMSDPVRRILSLSGIQNYMHFYREEAI